MNFLEQLTAEWHAYNDYFIRTNVKFGRRREGGYEGEMDVIAFDPNTKTLIHIETSSDADSWAKRIARFKKKFQSANRHYHSTFNIEIKYINKIAIVGYAKPRAPISFGNDIKHFIIPEYINMILGKLKQINLLRAAVPEQYPIIRAIQFTAWANKKAKQ